MRHTVRLIRRRNGSDEANDQWKEGKEIKRRETRELNIACVITTHAVIDRMIG